MVWGSIVCAAFAGMISVASWTRLDRIVDISEVGLDGAEQNGLGVFAHEQGL